MGSNQLPDISPSATDISEILKPWRTSSQREVADYNTMGPAIWLRTCYTIGSDEKHEALINGVDMDNAVDGDHRLLNDPTHYDYGADWQRVFEVLPELLEPNDQSWESYEENHHTEFEALRAYAEGGIARADQRLVDNLTGVSQGMPQFGFQGAELENQVAKALQSSVHKACVVAWVVLEDEEALESGKVALMFVDALGRVVRSIRVEVGEAERMGGFWADGSWDEIHEWEDGESGPEYRLGGSCGGLLLESIRGA
ncbi:MAG: hypothetical protein Q9228_001024 [Teloschistes exilis]